MSRWLEHRLGEFVDRSNELGRFQRVLDAQRQERIIVVWGEEACGKSSLLMRFAAELAQRQLPVVQIDWKGSRNYDYLAFMRAIRDQLRALYGPEQFAGFTDLVNFFTKPDYNMTLEIRQPGAVNVLNNASIEGSTFNKIAGVVIEDLKVVMPRHDLAISDVERVLQLTSAFSADLARLAADKRLVLLLDSVEKIDESTYSWLWTEFLPLLRQGQLGDTIVVLFGQKPPPNEGGWVRDVLELPLPPLGIADIKEYLLLRNAANDAELQSMAMMVAANTRGKAGSVAETVDLFLRFRENQVGET